MAKKWMAKAFGAHKGQLHRDLGVKEGNPIPARKLEAAVKGEHGRKVQERALAARTGARISRTHARRQERRGRAEKRAVTRSESRG